MAFSDSELLSLWDISGENERFSSFGVFRMSDCQPFLGSSIEHVLMSPPLALEAYGNPRRMSSPVLAAHPEVLGFKSRTWDQFFTNWGPTGWIQ